MLVRPHDAPPDDQAWRRFLRLHDFGQVIVPGAGRPFPVVVPTHFVLDGDEVLFHLARENPAWAALDESPRAVLAVVGDYAFVPGTWNARPQGAPEWGIPTSYYAAVQVEGTVQCVDDGPGLSRILQALFDHFQPASGQPAPQPGDNPFGREFKRIRGARLRAQNVRAKFKFGGNKTPDHRRRIAASLQQRAGPHDEEAARRILEAVGPDGPATRAP